MNAHDLYVSFALLGHGRGGDAIVIIFDLRPGPPDSRAAAVSWLSCMLAGAVRAEPLSSFTILGLAANLVRNGVWRTGEASILAG